MTEARTVEETGAGSEKETEAEEEEPAREPCPSSPNINAMLDILTPRSEPKDRLQKAKRLLTQAASRLQHQSSEDVLSAPESPIVLTVFVYETVGVRWVLSPHPKQVEWAGDCHVDGERTSASWGWSRPPDGEQKKKEGSHSMMGDNNPSPQKRAKRSLTRLCLTMLSEDSVVRDR